MTSRPSSLLARALPWLAALAAGCGPGLAPTAPPARELPGTGRASLDAPLHFGTVSESVTQSAREVVPLLEYLERVSGVPLKMRWFPDHKSQYEALLTGRVQLAWLNPVGYVQLRERLALEPVARAITNNSSTYRSVLVVRQDDPARDLAGLAGRRVAFTHSTSTSGYVFPLSFLEEKGLDPATYFSDTPFAGSHRKSLRGLVEGLWDGAFVEDVTLLTTRDEVPPESYRILAEVATIPRGPIVAHPDVGEARVEALRDAFLVYITEPLNGSLRFGLEKAAKIQGFKAARDEDYDDVRRRAPAGGGE